MRMPHEQITSDNGVGSGGEEDIDRIIYDPMV